jgi:hypothetical protein
MLCPRGLPALFCENGLIAELEEEAQEALTYLAVGVATGLQPFRLHLVPPTSRDILSRSVNRRRSRDRVSAIASNPMQNRCFLAF